MAISRRLRFEILRRDGHACRYCGRTAPEVSLTVDHVVPTALGGSDDPTNLVAACSECNAGKSASNPDATVVANVADDALRWAAAIRQSAEAMLADHAQREMHRREFHREWTGWRFGSKKMTLPLPDSWERSVDQFVSIGLPMPLLIDALRKAMQTEKVESSQTFRYMCGIAWKMVREIQDQAKNLIDAQSAPVPAPVAASELVAALWESLPFEEVGDDLVRQWAAKYRAEYEEYGWGPDLTIWSDDLCAFAHAINKLAEQYYSAIGVVTNLLCDLPADIRDHWHAKAKQACEEHGLTEDDDDDVVVRNALVMVFHDYQERTNEIRSDRPTRLAD